MTPPFALTSPHSTLPRHAPLIHQRRQTFRVPMRPLNPTPLLPPLNTTASAVLEGGESGSSDAESCSGFLSSTDGELMGLASRTQSAFPSVVSPAIWTPTVALTRPPRVALPPETVHPFEYNKTPSAHPLQTIKMIFVGIILLPLRVLYLFLLLALTAGVSRLVTAGFSDEQRRQEPIVGRDAIRRLLCGVFRWGTLALGYWRIHRVHRERYGQHMDGTHSEAPLIVCNHTTLQDAFVLLAEHNVSLVAKKKIVRLPLIHSIARAQQVLEVNQAAHSARCGVAMEMQRRLTTYMTHTQKEPDTEKESVTILEPNTTKGLDCIKANTSHWGSSPINETREREAVHKSRTTNMPSLWDSQSAKMQRRYSDAQDEPEKKEQPRPKQMRREEGHWLPLIIFPEATCTNARSIIQFKHEAFQSGLPVQPVVVRYNYKNFDQSWCGVESPVWFVMKMMCQLYNSMELIYLPVYDPSEEEKRDPALYARNVRRVMAEALNVPLTEHNYIDMKLMLKANYMRFPLEAVNVECGHPHFTKIPYERIERMLERFASALRANQTSSHTHARFCDQTPQNQTDSRYYSNNSQTTRNTFCFAMELELMHSFAQTYTMAPSHAFPLKGYMTHVDLGLFLSPLGTTSPLLLKRLMQHLTRRARVKGSFLTFRDFLSAFATEPVTAQLTAGERTLYMDEADTTEELTALLRRTFSMMIVASHALLEQRRCLLSSKPVPYPIHQMDPPVFSTHDMPNDVFNVSSQTDSPSRVSRLYGAEIRHPFLDHMLTVLRQVDITQDVLEWEAFGVLLDLLLVPHPSTMWGGEEGKSLTQRAQEKALFACMCGYAENKGLNGTPSASKGCGMRHVWCGEDVPPTLPEWTRSGTTAPTYAWRRKEVLSFHRFLRFGRFHRAFVEYIHASCEHYLLGDDLA